ncbi:unnamed protein product [Miscanthus lutarioriparius]|uniref:DOMON domain-containing protein n=1 Tax=Miscanthus lutarioriparius TaxID=422564 RepID=A0A811SL07_9POAL|nr:unnamed protein product [Miscanthus lutarioriparius]
MAARDQSALLLLAAVLLLFASSTATAQQQQQQNCSSAKFSAGRSFQRCTSLPVLGASLYWTYHAANGTADVAFRAPWDPSGWVAWGLNTQSAGSMAGSSVFIASQDGNGAVSVLMTYLESTNPSLTNNTLKIAVPVGPAAALRRRVHHLRDCGAAGEPHGAEHGVAGWAAQRRGNHAAPGGRAEPAERPEAGLPVRQPYHRDRGTQVQGSAIPP